MQALHFPKIFLGAEKGDGLPVTGMESNRAPFFVFWVTKVKYFADFLPYILIYGIFFVSLHPNLLCANMCTYACTNKREGMTEKSSILA